LLGKAFLCAGDTSPGVVAQIVRSRVGQRALKSFFILCLVKLTHNLNLFVPFVVVNLRLGYSSLHLSKTWGYEHFSLLLEELLLLSVGLLGFRR
jgi:hypothetical protein